jgi:proline racemase
MFGAVLVDPCIPKADIGVFFIHAGGYLNMCVHGTIGVVTAGVLMGFVPRHSPIVLETPSGIITAHWIADKDGTMRVSVRNVPSFVHSKEAEITLNGNKIILDIVFAGNFFALIRVDQIGKSVSKSNIRFWQSLGYELLIKLNSELTVKRLLSIRNKRIDLVEFYEEDNDNTYKSITIFGKGQFDRSPCGTGTTAKLALLHSQGRIEVGEIVTSKSVIGSKFEARVIETKSINQRDCVICEITGSAQVIGFGYHVIQPNDPFSHGFTIDDE